MDKKITTKELEEFITYLEEEGLLKFEDKVEIFGKHNVERLRTLAYLASLHIKKKLEEDEIGKYKEEKLKRVLSSLQKVEKFLVFNCPRDEISQENQSLEKIIGD
jgi:hypothetical protein